MDEDGDVVFDIVFKEVCSFSLYFIFLVLCEGIVWLFLLVNKFIIFLEGIMIVFIFLL